MHPDFIVIQTTASH